MDGLLLSIKNGFLQNQKNSSSGWQYNESVRNTEKDEKKRMIQGLFIYAK